MKKCSWLKFALFFIVVSCGQKIPDLENFDRETWTTDKNACSNKRSAISQPLLDQKAKLLSLNEMQIVELLGKPDRNELYKRNQKFYYYFIQPAPECENEKGSDSKKLTIRFTAMGVANEITIE
jgi:hypothetical protein